MIDEILDRILQRLPEAAEVTAKISQVRREAFGRPYEDFFEPKSVFALSGKSLRLIALSLPVVEAWAKHIAYSTRVRMLSFEPAILAAIVDDHLTPAMGLLRSYSETSGLACLALLTLRAADHDRLRDVMQRTLHGSALARGWKDFKDLSNLLPLSESQPPLAKDLMDALDSFVAAGEKGNGRYRAVYGLLCEFAHPNSRGMLGFARSTEVAPIGWRVRYSPTEEVGKDGQLMVLSLLLEMMRLGYSASELLRLGTVHEIGGGFSITRPEPRAVERVLRRLMLLDDTSKVDGHVM